MASGYAATRLARRTTQRTALAYADRREVCATLAYRAGSVCVAPDASGLPRTTETGWTLLELAVALRESYSGDLD